MQDNIDKIVDEYSISRSFVRPSGTEDCVRVYSGANTREGADILNKRVSEMVVQMIGKKQIYETKTIDFNAVYGCYLFIYFVEFT